MLLKPFNGCRRTAIAFYAIIVLGLMSYSKNLDTSQAIAMIALGLAGANSFQKSSEAKHASTKESK